MATYYDLMASIPTSTTSFFIDRMLAVLYANDPQVTLLQDLPWITTTSQEKSGDSSVGIVTTDSSEDIETESFYD